MRKVLFLVIFGKILLLAPAQPQEAVNVSVDDLTTLIVNAQKAEQMGEYDKAVSIYRTILFVDDKQPMPYLKIGNLYAADPSSAENVSVAIALYEKFLALMPNSRHTSLVKAQINKLQALIAENGWQQQTFDLTAIMQSGQKEMYDNVMAAKHPALAAQSKEEIVQQVNKTNELYNKAKISSNSNDGIRYYEEMLGQIDPRNPLYSQATMQLAELYGKQGNVEKMRDILASIETDTEINKNIMQYLNTKIRDAAHFEDDICGIWVSDLTYDINNDALPYLALRISKGQNGEYNSEVLPHCGFAKKNNMYKGKPFAYIPVPNKGVEGDYFAHSYFDSIISQDEIASFCFTNSKFRRGMSEGAFTFVAKTTDSFTEGLVGGCAGFDNVWAKGGCKLAMFTFGVLVKGIALLFTIDTKKTIHLAADMEQIFPGCLQLRLERTLLIEKSNGYERKSSDNITMKMYKIYPEYNIVFADKGNEIFGHNTFSQDEIKKTEEYEHLTALKGLGYFNRQSYKQLENKILDYCWAKSEEDPNMKIMAYKCMLSFENAKKGLFELVYDDADGSFEGWMDASHKKSGKGILMSNTGGYKYIGSFKNDYMEYGSLTVFYAPNIVKGEYTGSFKKSMYEGNGIHTAFNEDGDVLYTYEGAFSKGMRHGQGTLSKNDNSMYSGIWKKGEFVSGDGSFDGGFFTGKWKFLEKENRTVPNGKGVLVKNNSETTIGSWKNGALVVKPQKETKYKNNNQ